MAEETIFSRIAAGEISAEIVYQDEAVTAFRDINPLAPTHGLIVNCGPHGGQEVPHLHVHLLGGRPLGPMLAE
ncbi:MAG: HIT domain-containing protein [Gemmatimonadales bacterium]